MAYALQPTGAGYAPQQTGYARQETGASPEASFALCEARLCQRAANMVAALEALGALRGEARKAKLEECEDEFQGAVYELNRMEVQARLLRSEQGKPLQAKVYTFEKDLAALKEACVKAGGDPGRMDVKGNYRPNIKAGQKDPLLSLHQQLEKSNNCLKGSKRQMLTMQVAGQENMKELQRQREIIARSKRTMQQTNAHLDEAAGYTAQPTGYNPQPTGYNPQPGYNAQPTGYNAQPTGYNPQPTGYNAQPTGYNPQPTGLYNEDQPNGYANGYAVMPSSQSSSKLKTTLKKLVFW